jgi:hypothetical protein
LGHRGDGFKKYFGATERNWVQPGATGWLMVDRSSWFRGQIFFHTRAILRWGVGQIGGYPQGFLKNLFTISGVLEWWNRDA